MCFQATRFAHIFAIYFFPFSSLQLFRVMVKLNKWCKVWNSRKWRKCIFKQLIFRIYRLKIPFWFSVWRRGKINKKTEKLLAPPKIVVVFWAISSFSTSYWHHALPWNHVELGKLQMLEDFWPQKINTWLLFRARS